MNPLQWLYPISVRVPKKLHKELERLANKDRRSLSSYCRILIEDNYRSFGRNHKYDTWGYKEEKLVPLSLTLTKELKYKIESHLTSFKRPYYYRVSFSAFIRKVLSNSEKI